MIGIGFGFSWHWGWFVDADGDRLFYVGPVFAVFPPREAR